LLLERRARGVLVRCLERVARRAERLHVPRLVGPAVGEREDMVGVPPGLEELSAPGALVLERVRDRVALSSEENAARDAHSLLFFCLRCFFFLVLFIGSLGLFFLLYFFILLGSPRVLGNREKKRKPKSREPRKKSTISQKNRSE
jgi:hypothetical protein